MIKILANDGIDDTGKGLLEAAGFTVLTQKVAQENLIAFINEQNVDALLVRSATKVRKDLIDVCKNLKLVGRGGVGMDNIDVDYARTQGIEVMNTPAASTRSVAELVFAHLYGMVRNIYDSNRKMPVADGTKFNELKKKYANGTELKGKTMGIIGFGRIGQEVAAIAVGNGMNVLAFDPYIANATVSFEIFSLGRVEVKIKTVSLDEVLRKSDALTLHVPFTGGYLLTKEEFGTMKKGVLLVNSSRGEVINETDLIDALNSGQVAAAGLDVFANEPNINMALLQHNKVSLTPHIGAATMEAQERIGIEMAEKIIAFFKSL
jgi:D-3-phosphoglycerate dehydrogenase